MVFVNCPLHWSVNLVVMSVFIISELDLNYTHIYIYIYIYYLVVGWPPPIKNSGYATVIIYTTNICRTSCHIPFVLAVIFIGNCQEKDIMIGAITTTHWWADAAVDVTGSE